MYETMKRRLLHVFQINLPLFASNKIPGVPGLAVPFPGVMPEQLDFFMNPFYMIHRIIKLSLNLTVFFSVQLSGRGLFFYQECNQPYEGVQDPGRSPRGPIIRGKGKGGCLPIFLLAVQETEKEGMGFFGFRVNCAAASGGSANTVTSPPLL